jgi:hypothetical protein
MPWGQDMDWTIVSVRIIQLGTLDHHDNDIQRKYFTGLWWPILSRARLYRLWLRKNAISSLVYHQLQGKCHKFAPMSSYVVWWLSPSMDRSVVSKSSMVRSLSCLCLPQCRTLGFYNSLKRPAIVTLKCGLHGVKAVTL